MQLVMLDLDGIQLSDICIEVITLR